MNENKTRISYLIFKSNLDKTRNFQNSFELKKILQQHLECNEALNHIIIIVKYPGLIRHFLWLKWTILKPFLIKKVARLSTLAIKLNLEDNIKQKNCYDMFYNIGNKLASIL